MLEFPNNFFIKKSFKDIPQKEIQFISREDYLNQIIDVFKMSQVITICGYGGLGKTVVAREYCKRLLQIDSESNIRWFDATSILSIETEYRAFSSLLNVNDNNFDSIVLETKNKLESFNKDILLVFDNVEDFSYIENYIKNLPKQVRILITSRDQFKNIEYPKIDLEPFGVDEAEYYLNKNINKALENDQTNTLIELVKTKQNQILPIKLEKVASYLNYYSLDNVDKLLDDLKILNYHNYQVETTLFSQLNSDISIELLQYCSYLSPDFISLRILFKLFDKQEPEYQITRVVSKLSRLSLLLEITNEAQQPGVRIHRLIQEELKNYTQMNRKYPRILDSRIVYAKLIECVDDLFEYVTNEPKCWERNHDIYKQALWLYKFYTNPKNKNDLNDKPDSNVIISLLKKLFKYEFETNKAKESDCLAKVLKVFQMQQKLFDLKDHPDITASLIDIGRTYKRLKEYNKALEYCVKGLEMQQRICGDVDHLDLSRSLNLIGSIHDELNQHKQALECKLKAFEMQKRLLGNVDHRYLARSLINIGFTYSNLSEYEKALDCQVKGLDMMHRLYDIDHPDLAFTLNNIGLTYAKLDDNQKAFECQQKALEMRQRLYANVDHLDLAHSFSNIGNLYDELNEHQKALEFKLKALKIYQTNMDYLDEAMTLNDIGFTHIKLNEISPALNDQLKALCMMRELYKGEHPHISFILNNIGFTYGLLKEHKKALEHHLEGLEMNKKLCDNKDHPDLARSLINVGVAYENLNDIENCLDFKVRGFQMFQRLIAYSNNSKTNITDLKRSISDSGKPISMYKNKYFKLKCFEDEEYLKIKGIAEGYIFKNGRYEVIRKLGQGGFGDVFLVRDVTDKKEYALKKIRSIYFSDEELNEMNKEISLHKKIKNEFIIEYIDHFLELNYPCIVIAFYKDGDLEQYIDLIRNKNEQISADQVLNWSKQILNGLNYLHKEKIMHRDIKPSNLFRDGDKLVIGDLGISKSTNSPTKTNTYAGTIQYISPEIIEKQKYSFKTDVWSFGCVLYELVELKKLFNGENDYLILNSILKDTIPNLNQSRMNVIFQMCLVRNPSKRSNVDELIAMITKMN